MGTRSTIALEFADGTVESVYCHWDGYLEHNGKILLENYTDPFKLRDLIDLGDISSLGKEIGSKHPFSPHSSPADEIAYHEAVDLGGATTFYGRDRGEAGVSAKSFVDFQHYLVNHQYEEYEYILRRDGNWYVKCHDEPYALLTEAFKNIKEEA
jgi:hypothetical protein